MSGKIKSKDLSYDSTLPPFLQRLHEQQAGLGDRHERPMPRPKKDRDPNDDNGPTIVQESGDTLTREEYERLAAVEDSDRNVKTINAVADAESEQEMSGALPTDEEGITLMMKLQGAASTPQKKRKAAKVIGDGEVDDDLASKDENTTKPAKKAKKKAKAVKLAFDDDDA